MSVKRWIFRISLLVGTAALSCLIFGELYLRIKDPIDIFFVNFNEYVSRKDNQIYEPRAGTGAYNNDGVRADHNISVVKPDGDYRIEILGDSLAFGLGIDLQETYAKQLERKLNASASGTQTYEVINLGVPGYNISQIISRFREKGLKYHPDMAIYHYWLDDIYVSDSGQIAAVKNPILRFVKFIKDKGGVKSKNLLVQLPARLFDLQIGRHLIDYLINKTDISIDKDYYSNQQLFESKMTPTINSLYEKYIHDYNAKLFSDLNWSEEYYVRYKNRNAFLYWNYYLSQFSEICRNQRIVCMIILTPVLYTHAPGDYNWSQLNAFITTVINQYGIDVIDMTSKFDKYNGKDLRATKEDPEHPNAFGNRLIADALYQALIQKLNIHN